MILCELCEGLVEPVDCTKYITWPSEHQLLPLYSYQFFRRHTSINLVFLSINSYRRHVLHFFQAKISASSSLSGSPCTSIPRTCLTTCFVFSLPSIDAM